MKNISVFRFVGLFVSMVWASCLMGNYRAQAQTAEATPPAKPAEIQITGGPIPTRVLLQSPVETVTELQIICLFESAPENRLHGSLLEINEKLKGLLDQIRK